MYRLKTEFIELVKLNIVSNLNADILNKVDLHMAPY